MNTPERRLFTLKKLAAAAKPLSLADLAPMIGSETVRTMAAHGWIKVEITITAKGCDLLNDGLEKQHARVVRRAMKAHQERPLHPETTTPIMVPASSLKSRRVA